MNEQLVRDMIVRSAANKPWKTAYMCGAKKVTWSEIHRRSDALSAGIQAVSVNIVARSFMQNVSRLFHDPQL
ncbi:hypothetical protein Q6D67_20610, partial [Haliea sp. E1-2-M8]|uniref:hypothetical protein n=1 Tax=Haliea sp. E1-2-M8 TaxID=3064706 RepID=UPI00271BD0D2